MSEVSIIVPVKDEVENIEKLAGEISAAMHDQPYEWECVWIDDGSTDGTLSILQGLAQKYGHHRYVSLAQNAGQSAALCAGFDSARGDILATIDGDGQNDPADLPGLIAMVRSGEADMANGYRAKREDRWLRRLSSRIANAFRNKMTGKTVRDVGCSTRAFRRECVAHLPRFAGMHRFFPTLVTMQGWTLAEKPVNHRPRLRGVSKYGLHNRLWVGLMDTFGVLWLQRRAFTYRIGEKS